MANSLDKLRALTVKLEERLSRDDNFSGTMEQKRRDDDYDDSLSITTVKALIDSFNEGNTEALNVNVDKLLEEEHDFGKMLRYENLRIIKSLYHKLEIYEKSPDLDDLFMYKAMNLSGIGLKDDDFAEVRSGKYIQVIAITYEPDDHGKKKAKNISLGYFGKGESIDPKLKRQIIEFVLRWRYEKAFQNVEHYKILLEKLD